MDSAADLLEFVTPPNNFGLSSPAGAGGNATGSASGPVSHNDWSLGLNQVASGRDGGLHTQSPQFMASTSNSVVMLPDILNMPMYANKNESQQMVVHRTVAFRLYNPRARLAQSTGNCPEMTCSYTVPVLQSNLDRMYVASSACDPTNAVCRLWEIHLFRHRPSEVQLSALLLIFDQQRNLQPATSVYLQYFLRCCEIPPMSHLVLRCCLEGLEDFFEVVLGWLGLLRDLIRSFRNGDFEIYSVDYLQCQIYGALALFMEKARGARDSSLTPADWETYFASVFRELKTKLSYEACQRYEKFKSIVPLPTGLAPLASAGVLHPDVKTTRGGDGTASGSQTDMFKNQVCVKDVMRHFGILQQNGQKYKKCGELCTRRHMDSLTRNPVPLATMIEQIRKVIHGEAVERAVDAVKADLSGCFTA
jgi:hypothetical protein